MILLEVNTLCSWVRPEARRERGKVNTVSNVLYANRPPIPINTAVDTALERITDVKLIP